MSNSRQISDGRRLGKAPETSVFTTTCNLLSRYIKEKGSLKDFNLKIDGKIECLESLMKSKSSVDTVSASTMNLLTHMEKSAQPVMETSAPLAKPDIPIVKVEDSSNKASTSKEASVVEPKSGSQLTIFYAGKVLVFENCPADKARELVMLATKGRPQISGGVLTNILPENANPMPKNELTPKPNIPNGGGLEKAGSEAAGAVGKSTRVPEVNGSDLPIARRSSVHRFLEKRKERAAARGPYQILENQQGPSSSSSKGDGHFELKL